MHGTNLTKGSKRWKMNSTGSKKKLLGTQDDSVTTMMCQLLKQQSEWNGIPTTQWNSTILRQSSTKLSRRE